MATANPNRLQLYGTGSATGTSVAQVTVPTQGHIIGINVLLLVTSITASGVCRIELSRVPTNQTAVNGAVDPIIEVGIAGNFVTSGMTNSGVNQFFPVKVAVRQGELIYLHATVAGTLTYYANFILIYG